MQLVINANHSISFDKEMQFLIANGIEYVYKQTESAFEDFVECEKERIYSNSKINLILVIFGICVLAICTGLLIYYIFSIGNNYNMLWNFIINITHASYAELKSSCLDRLSELHGNDYNQEENPAFSNKKSKESINFNENRRFIVRLGIFLVLTTVYYIVVHFAFYSSCEQLLAERPELLSIYIKRRLAISRIDFWARESNLYGTDISLDNLFPLDTIFKNPKEELESTISLLRELNSKLIENMSHMPNELIESLFEHGNSTDVRYQYGGIWFTNDLLFEALYLENSDKRNLQEIMTTTASFAIALNSMSTNFKIIDDSSVSTITDKLNYIIYSIIVYSLVSLGLYFIYYLPYLSHKIDRLHKLETIISIIPKRM